MKHSFKLTAIYFFSFLLFANTINAQAIDSIVKIPVDDLYNPACLKLTAEVKIVDSQYILIPQLKILEQGKVIQLHKNLYPGIGNSPIADIQIVVAKQVRCAYQNIYVAGFRQPAFDEDFMVLRDYKFNDRIKDSIDLDPFFALETGHYRVLISLKYFAKGKEGLVNSEWVDFDVLFVPKNSLWGNCK